MRRASGNSEDLRLQAEEVLMKAFPNGESDNPVTLSSAEAYQLMHELRVHRIELEIQNEDLRQTHLDLEVSRAQYFDLYDLAPVGYVTLDQSGVIDKANLTFARLLGLDRHALSEVPFAQFISREDQDSYYLLQRDILRKGGRKTCEIRMTKTDGTGFWARLELAATAECDEKTPEVRVVIMDITKRKLMEEALRQSKEQLSTELEAAKHLQEISTKLIDSVETLYDEILDTAKAILRSDCATLHRFCPHLGAEGKLHLLRHRGFNKYAAAFWEWVSPHSSSSYGMALRTCERIVLPDIKKHGPTVNQLDDLEAYLRCGIEAVQTTPLLSRNGTLLGVLSTHWRKPYHLTPSDIRSLDVLARQAADLLERMLNGEALAMANKELRMANHRKDEFLGILSHEIRNPLAAISLALGILDLAEPGGERFIRAKDIMNRQIGHLTRLIDDLLDITRITLNKIVLQKKRVDLKQLVMRAVDDYAGMFREKGVGLEVDCPSTVLEVYADDVRLAQVFGNLLHNAVKFTETGGSTVVSFSQCTDACVVIRIKDTGIGMDPKILPSLFQPFVQAHEPRDPSDGSLGLGLALVKGLIELHGGTVTAHSDGIGRGTEFRIHMPLSDVKDDETGQTQSLISSQLYGRVLVVEDNPDIAETLKTWLENDGHQVAVAYNGNEGIMMAKSFQPEAVLCDIGLPGMDGYEVARAFSQDEAMRSAFLIAITGYARPDDIRKTKESGFHSHMAKPVDLEALRKILGK